MIQEGIKNRMFAKLGAPVMAIELEDQQISDLFGIATRDFRLYSSLSKLDEEKKESISYEWIESYFQALCKESLGRIRGKYRNGLPIPGQENMLLDFDSLLNESTQEKERLISLLIPSAEKILLACYINVGNMDDVDARQYVSKMREALNRNNKAFIHYIIAVRDQETRIECVYPSFVLNEDIKERFNICLDRVLKNIENE